MARRRSREWGGGYSALSTKQVNEASVNLPEGVSATLEGRLLTLKGPLGSVKKNFDRISVDLSVDKTKVLVKAFSAKKGDAIVSNTVLSLVTNMVTGVTKGYEYKLKVVYAHFPISVKVKGDTVLVENFVGERSPRVASIVGGCKVTTEGDDVIVRGVSLEDVGQTAANIELATKIKHKDQRIFLDGLYIFEKKEGW